ncbi:MAG: DEAD/DEAH box helicase, partial [Gammaproteobacteria bacterium]
MSFAHLGLSETLLRAVADLGHQAPTPVQERTIPLVMAGRDVLAAAQTGTGKTAAFAQNEWQSAASELDGGSARYRGRSVRRRGGGLRPDHLDEPRDLG